MTAGPAARVAAMLELMRPAVDELFVALDGRAGPEVAASVQGLADRTITFNYREPVDRPLAWLHSQCESEWVLTIDDDEVPSAGLLAALPELARAEDVTHYWVPRRWLHPDVGRYLSGFPWQPDYQLRLVRNDPRLLRFPDETHRPIAALGPGRYLDLPVYHADCIVSTRASREAKARKYELLRPGKRAGGGPANRTFYLPELRPDAETAPVPPEDRPLVDRVLASPERPHALNSEGARPERADDEEIDRMWAGRELSASDYRAHLEPEPASSTMVAGEDRTVDVRVANLGETTWDWGPDAQPAIRLVHRWQRADGGGQTDGCRPASLPAPLEPGHSQIVPVPVAAPNEPGVWRLELDLVHEGVRAFGCESSTEIEILPARRVALAGPEAALRERVERLAELEPGLEPVAIPIEHAPGDPLAYASRGVARIAAHVLPAAARRPRALATALWAGRTGAIVRAARRRTAAPEGGRTLLEELSACGLLVLECAGPVDWPGGVAALCTVLLAARAQGVPVAIRTGRRTPLSLRVLLRVLAGHAGRRVRGEGLDGLAPDGVRERAGAARAAGFRRAA